MSLLGKVWKIKNTDPSIDIQEKVLLNRGLVSQLERETFLAPETLKFHDPFLMKNMTRAVERIKKAIADNERVIIFGDYDVDGISGTAILMHTLKRIGANVSYRLPHRIDDGYSISDKFIEEFKAIGVQLLITVDCGVSARPQIQKAVEYGIDVIVTDHHTIPENFPEEAYAILHPLQVDCPYPFKGLTGTGVAFKLAQALLSTSDFPRKDHTAFLDSLLEFACFGTIADLGPLVDENRLIVKKGLAQIQNSRWPGISLIKKNAGINTSRMNTQHVGFRIAPRINAAGRIAHPYIALQLLLQEDSTEKTHALAQELETLNHKRQQMVEKAIEETRTLFDINNPPQILIAHSRDWHTGILGLIAGKLAEEFARPAIIFQEFDDHLVASARSPEWCNVVEMITLHKDLLVNFGGHAQAAGLTVSKDKFSAFKEAISQTAVASVNSKAKSTLDIDAELTAEDITSELHDFLQTLEPYGVGNQFPKFLVKNIPIENIRIMGRDLSHVRFQTQVRGTLIHTVAFKFGKFMDQLRGQTHIDLVFELQKNDRYTSQLELKVVDIALTE